MATTEHFYAGTGTQTSFPFEFPYLTESDVFVELYNSSTGNFDLKQQNTSGQNNDYSISNTNIVFNTAPPQIAGIDNIHIYRNTDVETAKAVYNTGSAIRAQDLNNNTDQALYKLQEGTQLITTGDIKDEAIDSSKIKDATIVNTDISPTAEIAVSKLADGSARQLLQTDAAGTGVEWTSNVDIPGTLDVTGNTDIDGTLNVDGNATLQGTTTLATVDINAGNIDNTVIGATTPVNASFNFTTTSSAYVSAYPTDPTAYHIVLSNNIISGNPLKISSYQEPDSNGNALGNNATTQVLQNLSVAGDLSVTGNIAGGSIDATSLASIPAANFVRADTSDTLTGSFYSFEGPTPNSSVVNYATLRGRDLKLEFGSGNNYQAQTMQIQAQRHGVMDNNGNFASINDINLGAGNLGLPWGSTELNSNQIGHVSRISLGRAYMTVAKANNIYSTNQLVMRASYPDGLMFYHPDTPTTGAEYYLSGSNMPGDATYGNSYEDNITEARNNADMRIIQGGILAKNKVEIGSSTVTGTLQISGTDVTSTATELNKLDGYTGTTTELNKLDGFTGSTADLNEVVTGKNVVETITGSATDAQLPTAQAVNERIVELVTEVGGFHPIANETSFPTTNPDINDGAGTIVSLKALSSAFSTGSGVTTHTFTNGAGSGVNVIINGLPASTTFQAGKGLLLETTSTLHTYNYHRLVLDESGVSNADALVSAFNERYYGPFAANQSTRPSGANRVNGDLYFNTSDGKMKVWNGSHASGTWDDVAAPGNFFINTLSSSSGSGGGSATFNGTATRFTLSNPPLTAQQLLVSVNGVIQKPNSGTSPSEGFAIDSADIIFASAPATGAPHFIVTIGSSVNIGTPSNDTVGAAQIIDGSISNAEISSSAAIAKSKIETFVNTNADNRVITGSDTANTLNGEAGLTYDGSTLTHTGTGYKELKVNTTTNNSTTLRLQNSSANFSISNITGGTFSVSDGGTTRLQINSSGNVDIANNLDVGAGVDVTGDITGTGDLTIDTNTLHVDSTLNRVGIGTTTPIKAFHNALDTTLITGTAPQIRLNGNANDGNDNDRAILGLATANSHFFNTSAAGDAILRATSTGNLLFGSGGTERMRLLSSGDVGIGTSNPQAKLHLDTGASGLPKIRLQHSSSGNDVFEITGGLAGVSNGGFGIYDVDETTYRLAIDSSGNVGIGTTSPTAPLTVRNSDDSNLNTIEAFNDNGNLTGSFSQNSAGDGTLGTRKNDGTLNVFFRSNGVSYINGGNVGIGTTSPNNLLHIKTGTSDAITPVLFLSGTFADNDGSEGTAIDFGTGAGTEIGARIIGSREEAGARGALRFCTGREVDSGFNNGRMVIDASGNVGIGTTSPSEKLHVNGDVLIDGAAGGTLTLGGSAAHTSKIVIGDNNGTGNGNLLIEGADGTDFITISSGGNVEIHDGNLKFASGHGIDFSATSDATGSTSEKFDDYEEGTFTPDWQGTATGGTTTSGTNNGSYTKIGNTVHVRIYTTITGTTATGAWIMHNLPFIGVNSLAGITTGSCMLNYLNWHANSSYVVPYKNSNTNDFDLYACGDNDAWRSIQIADDSAFEIILGLTYQAA